jgi:hypothetical protein
MANKVIFLSLTPDSGLIPFEHKPFFDQNNIKCEYWDLRYLAQHERSTELKLIYTPYDDVPILNPQIEELEKYVKENADSVFIAGYRITRHNRILFKLFKKYNIKYVVLINTNTFFHLKSGEVRRKYTKKGNLSFLLELSLRNIQKTFNNIALDIQRPYLTICGSINDKIVSNFPEPKEGVTYIHNHNYEKLLPYLSQKQEEKYIVFLDQYLPWHNEAQKFNKWQMNANNYYTKLAVLLNKIGIETGKQPLIATHPKAEKGKIEPYVGNIRVVYGETPEAILASKICVLHSSTSVDHAILLEKEVVFMLCDEVLNSPIEIGTKLMAKEFNKRVLVSEDYLKNNQSDILSFSKVNKQSYRNYINNNIKAGEDINIPYWKYIANKIKNI